jgi:hypothetical protein
VQDRKLDLYVKKIRKTVCKPYKVKKCWLSNLVSPEDLPGFLILAPLLSVSLQDYLNVLEKT